MRPAPLPDLIFLTSTSVMKALHCNDLTMCFISGLLFVWGVYARTTFHDAYGENRANKTLFGTP